MSKDRKVQMKYSGDKDQRKKKVFEVTTFPVPFALGEIKENISISTNTPTKPTQEQIINQALLFHSQGNISEAAKCYQYFINKGFKDHRVFSNYGIILKSLGNLKEAELLYRKAIEIKPDYAEAYYNLGIILKDLGKLKEAFDSYLKAIEIKPNFANAHYNFGRILKDLGNLKEAELSIRKSIEINPDFTDAHLNLGNILRDLGNLKEAEWSTRKAIELNPNKAEPHSNLGNILSDLGRLQEAEWSTRKAIELNPNFAKAHYNLGMILINLGNHYDAELSLRKAINLEPSLTYAVEELARRLYLDKKYDLAIQCLQKNKSYNCQSLYLSCLLCLDRKDDFNQKYKELYHKKICNADMSGIVEHANIIYEQKNESHFCNESINYILLEKIDEQLFSDKHFCQLISYIKSNELKTKPQSLIHKASQSTGNLFLLDFPFIKALKKAIEIKIKHYKTNFKDSQQGFIENWPTVYTLRSWILCMKNGGFIKPHNHRYGWITGSFYLNVPKNTNNNNAGNISFSYQGPEYPKKDKSFDSTIKKIETRDICIFPSSLFHHTIPFQGNEDRICVVFDLAQKTQN